MSSAPDLFPSGYKLGRYIIQSELAPARMGRVYKALDPLRDRPVAINVLAPDLGPNGQAIFLDCVRRACEKDRAGHGGDLGSAAVLDLCQLEGVTAVVVAYVDGVGAALDVATV